jgi:hypothetical protein
LPGLVWRLQEISDDPGGPALSDRWHFHLCGRKTQVDGPDAMTADLI